MTTFTANFRHGHPMMVDHTPSVFVPAGAVVVIGVGTRIAHVDIPANTLGALAAGHGVYLFPKATTAGTAIPAGTKVFWDAVGQVVTTSATNNNLLGETTQASTDADDHQSVMHLPD